jgi:TRAP-type C4-dicarboxylate transport system substrate-binding protein
MFESYEEWDYVRREMNQDMEQRLEAKGFQVLTWSDVGWVHFFSKQPMQTPTELEKMKLAASVTQPVIVEITKWAGFRPVPITTADMVAGLQTGLIDAFYVPIYVAEASNLYRYAKNMNGLKWAPLQGAVVIRSEDWNKVGSEYQAKIREIATQIGEKLRSETRSRESASLEAMKKRGLKVWEVDDETRKEWYRRTAAAYPKIRNELLTPEVFDKVLRLRDSYRAEKADGS